MRLQSEIVRFFVPVHLCDMDADAGRLRRRLHLLDEVELGER